MDLLHWVKMDPYPFCPNICDSLSPMHAIAHGVAKNVIGRPIRVIIWLTCLRDIKDGGTS